MGGAKFAEENAERLAESMSWQEQKEVFIPPHKVIEPTVSNLRYCPLCIEGFTCDELLQKHISQNHGRQHVYFRVNGRIERDCCWLENKVTDCEIVLLDTSVRLQVDINGETTFLNLTKTTSLKKQLRNLRPGDCATLVTDSPFKRTLNIFVGSQPDFSSQQMDDELRVFMKQGFTSMSKKLQNLRTHLHALGTNTQERRYAEGMTEFCHAMILRQRQSDYCKDRLEEAFSLLIPFETAFAMEARAVLALIMNCFQGEWPTRPKSKLDVAKWFYCGTRKPRAITIDPIPLVIFDPLTDQLLQAIVSFFTKDYRAVLDLLNSIEKKYSHIDTNDRVKLDLLEARASKVAQEVSRAESAYLKLSDHKLFNREAQTYLKHSERKSTNPHSPR